MVYNGFLKSRISMNITRLFTVFIVVLLGLIIFLKSTAPTLNENALDSNAVILAFGDSLTYGKGAPQQSYPVQLEVLIQRKVINAGISGEPSAEGLKRLPNLLDKHRPKLVIICHGGNDIIRKMSKEQLRSNLIQMIRLSKEKGAQVLLVGGPNFGLIGFSTEELYEEVAEQEEVFYEGDILGEIENKRALKSDRIHPNAKGYGLMAEAFAEVLRDNGLIE